MTEKLIDPQAAVDFMIAKSKAYASSRYKEHLKALQQAVEAREELRWMLIAAQARIEVWRSQEASSRAEGKVTI